MRAGGVEVSVPGVEVEVFERFVDLGLAFEEIDIFEGVLGMMVKKVLGESFEVLVSARAFAGFEVVAFGQIETSTGSAFLEIVAAGIVLSDDALQSGVDPVPIIDGMATILVPGLLEKWCERSEKLLEGGAQRGVL